jgi:type IX secretion system PorP/SprF family membrane protein
MTMRHILFICFCLVALSSSAQQLPLYSQYMNNELIINPAVSGTQSYSPLQISFRNQWAGFNGSPNTQAISFHRRQKKNVGLGAVLFNDNTGGAINRTGLVLSYAYHIPVANGKLSLALAANINQYTFNSEGLTPNDPDPIIDGSSESSFVPDATFGAYYFTDKFFAGFSVPNLIETPININTSVSSTNSLIRHYFLHTGYKLEINDNVDLQPSLMLKSILSTGVQYDLNLRATFKDKMWLGASYRDQDAVVMMFGVNYNNYIVGYSYDVTMSDIGNYSNGSHEVFLGYKLDVVKTEPQKKDSDGDGVPDEEDPCPDEIGTKENRGCPDKDGDSVIDKIDACPDTAGPADNQGCPLLTYEQKAVVDTAFTNLEFEFGKAIITFDSYTHLDRLGVMLVNTPSMILTIEGHTDNIGGDEKNMELSEARATAIKSYLTTRGIPEQSIIVLFYGENRPVAPNDTEEGREKNRRVELTIGFN